MRQPQRSPAHLAVGRACLDGGVSLTFTAIDFETANSHGASACQVGMVRVEGGQAVARLESLIKPPMGYDEFLPWNVRVHGIRPAMVADAPELPELLPQMLELIGAEPMVAHNAPFDMSVLRAAARVHQLDLPPLQYLCSVRLARKTWRLDSYRLPDAAFAAGFEGFQHHDALADAEACAAIVIGAARRHHVASLAELCSITGVKPAPVAKPERPVPPAGSWRL